MRIAEFGKYYPPHPGGIESYVQQCCSALSHEHEVRAFVYNTCMKQVHDTINDIRVYRAPRILEFASQPVALTLGHNIKLFSPDLLHLHWPNPLSAIICETQLKEIPVVVTHHADITRQRLLRHAVIPTYRKLLKRATSVIVTSGKTAAQSNDLGRARRDTTMIPIGVNEASLALTPTVERYMDYLRRVVVNRNHLVVGFVGRLVSYKGIDVLLKALVGLPGVSAIIAGDGPLRATLQAAAYNFGVADRVKFLGQINDFMRAALYRTIDIFVLPSVSTAETFGIVQVEAQLCQCPIIASNLSSGVTEVTIHGTTGLCVQPGNSEALAEAVKLLAANPELRKRFGKAGFERASALYKAAAVDERLREHFRFLESRLNARVHRHGAATPTSEFT
ncbi:MAG: glycosyltransferase [Rhodospirillales bacterium]|nr:glycosyltransferase [Rhodospirillales bacterium]